MSLSDDPALVGRPEQFEVTVRNVILSAGAGFIVPLLGTIVRMPGLPRAPQAAHIDLVDGEPQGIKG
jgi:formate--tetrahydrofolate ligase